MNFQLNITILFIFFLFLQIKFKKFPFKLLFFADKILRFQLAITQPDISSRLHLNSSATLLHNIICFSKSIYYHILLVINEETFALLILIQMKI